MSAVAKFDSQKARALAEIAKVKAGPNPREALLTMQARFREIHGHYQAKKPQFEQLFCLLGADPERAAEELGEFPAWLATQIELALAEVSA